MPVASPDIKGIKKFRQYRKKGLTYREIEKLMGKKCRTLTRWNKYIVDKKLSTADLA